MSSSIATTDRAISPGSLVLVTGANGFIASHICKQLLENGPGTVRDINRTSWPVPFFNSRYGEGSIELISVPDMAADSAFDNAVKGCAGVIHTATPVMQIQDPNVAIPTVINGTVNALRAAAREPSVKRVVLTSSSTAAASPQPNKIFTIDPSTWNGEAVKAAWAPPPYLGVQRKLDVYYASKTQGEQAAWKFMEDENPDFVLNCILPNMNIGEILSIEHQGYPSTMSWIKALWGGFNGEGEKDLEDNPPQYYVNVDDNAVVHVAALVFGDVKRERLFTFAEPYSWNDLLAIFRRLYPEREFMDDIEGLGVDKSVVANERAQELLKRLKGSGWDSLEIV
ncbi:aldehyde reductase II [Lindgomyces ingoldianus]|uniref:Aldehyde reductase II n=1 Tax=Lindgomyces ingoldianus TaxID=673940 RepID=A0ACB6QI98_9PLEO|nr:aldehyde reductase II [Lindgomyces ingoldianus]KAF2466620.1 aldehyde reductase II [Lindgomyces ingoldianus]